MRPGRLWWLIRRDLKRGLPAAYHHYVTLPRILTWRPPGDLAPEGAVPVHVLTRGGDWLMALWMLASWFRATGRRWRVVVHDDGTLPPEALTAFRETFCPVTLLSRAEADEMMAPVLADYPLIARYRREHPLALKLFDAARVSESQRYLALDSDILFFNRPGELLRHVEVGERECWFNRDVAEGSLIGEEEARSHLGIDLWRRVNSGLGLVWSGAIDLELCERALRESRILSGHPWRVEQTLYALCASRHGRGGLLGDAYEISLGKRKRPGSVCRHYVGAVRDRFYAEGVAKLARELVPQS